MIQAANKDGYHADLQHILQRLKDGDYVDPHTKDLALHYALYLKDKVIVQ